MFRENLFIGRFILPGFFIKQASNWPCALIIGAEPSIFIASRRDLFILLKSYLDNEGVLVEKIFFVISARQDNQKIAREIVYAPPLRELLKINELGKFEDWWEIFAQKT